MEHDRKTEIEITTRFYFIETALIQHTLELYKVEQIFIFDLFAEESCVSLILLFIGFLKSSLANSFACVSSRKIMWPIEASLLLTEFENIKLLYWKTHYHSKISTFQDIVRQIMYLSVLSFSCLGIFEFMNQINSNLA